MSGINSDSHNSEDALKILRDQQGEPQTVVKALPCFVHCFSWRGAEEEMKHEDLLAGLEALEIQISVSCLSCLNQGNPGVGVFLPFPAFPAFAFSLRIRDLAVVVRLYHRAAVEF